MSYQLGKIDEIKQKKKLIKFFCVEIHYRIKIYKIGGLKKVRKHS